MRKKQEKCSLCVYCSRVGIFDAENSVWKSSECGIIPNCYSLLNGDW